MRIVSANIFALNIPFVESFDHNLKKRKFSDSIIVKLTTESGLCGYGEGIARPYVTGETVENSMGHLEKVLLPAIVNRDVHEINTSKNPLKILSEIHDHIPTEDNPGIISWSASKTAVELALIDCILKEQNLSLNCILPAKSKVVTYSGVITSCGIDKTIGIAKYFKQIGFEHVKIKITKADDLKRIAVTREILGPSVSIRLDVNGAFNVDKALEFISSAKRYNIDSIEQPIKRGNVTDLALVKANSSVPIMADESIVTMDDANMLIEANACDIFNLRISKCGGLYNTLVIAKRSREMGMKIQLGCLVGETAILSAAGRHLAAFLSEVRFVEGSYSTYLLAEDIAREEIKFGHKGKAPVFTKEGLGINIKEDLLRKYAESIIHVS